MDAWLAGLIAGLIASMAMMPLMMPASPGPPGPSRLLAKTAGGDASSMPMMMGGMMGHFVYGGFWGLVFAVLFVDVFATTTALWAWGILLGVFLMMVMMVVWAPATGMRQDMQQMAGPDRMRSMALAVGAHVVYGVVVGAIVQWLI
jgi:hypothetical protein